jgi:hypothetical protein
LSALRPLVTSVVALLAVAACVTNVQQQAAFGNAPVVPDPIPAHVGDIVRFDVRPPVAPNTWWSLQCHGRVRFADDPAASSMEWAAETRPIHMETIVSPWDPGPGKARAAARGWLWYGLREHGESEPLDKELPVQRLEFREIAPVTFGSTYTQAPGGPRISSSSRNGRVTVTYTTPVEPGVPSAPGINAMLLETGGKKILYAEVRTNFGALSKERLGYDVTLSYAESVGAPVEVIVVGWIGHGEYYGPFSVQKLVVPSAPGSDAPAGQPGPPPPAAGAPQGAAPAPPAEGTPPGAAPATKGPTGAPPAR